jgi:hypothetical protein
MQRACPSGDSTPRAVAPAVQRKDIMKITIEMPTVDACGATGCAYNVARRCHAQAITVGGGTHPACDTYIAASKHPQNSNTAGVGACKVEECRHNKNFACEAASIEVSPHGEHADCITYEPRDLLADSG